MTGTLVYDADCGFCTRCAEFARARLRRGHHVVPSHAIDPDVGLSREELDAAAWWVPDAGTPQRGHRAIAAALGACRGGWPLLGRIIGARAMEPIASRVYDRVAANRYRLPGSDGTCNVSE